MKTALVIGATGLVGTQLVKLLLNDSRFDKVKVFVRRSVGTVHDKLEEYLVDYDELEKWKKHLTGDVLYSALGTTLRTAGSKEAQYKIDYTYQYLVAKAAAINGVSTYVLISAAGSSANSKIFYSRIKGELERDIKRLPFETIHIIRPGMLAGERIKVRTGEQLTVKLMSALSAIPGLHSLRPIQGREVAQAMVNATFRRVTGVHAHTMSEVFKLAQPVVI